MQPTVRFNSKGFTFVEVLVALLIMMISMLAILEATVMAMQQNLENFSRNESIRIAEQAMNEARITPFTGLSNITYNVARTYKQHTRTFTVNRTVTQLSASSASIQLQVAWTINGKSRSHSISSIIVGGT